MLDQNIIIAKQKWAQQVVTNAKSILVRNRKIATGALYNSVRYVVLSNGDISEESLTYLISRGIAEKGIRPVPFMREAIKQSIKQLARELKKEATKATVNRLRAAAKSINKP